MQLNNAFKGRVYRRAAALVRDGQEFWSCLAVFKAAFDLGATAKEADRMERNWLRHLRRVTGLPKGKTLGEWFVTGQSIRDIRAELLEAAADRRSLPKVWRFIVSRGRRPLRQDV